MAYKGFKALHSLYEKYMGIVKPTKIVNKKKRAKAKAARKARKKK